MLRVQTETTYLPQFRFNWCKFFRQVKLRWSCGLVKIQVRTNQNSDIFDLICSFNYIL